MRITKLVLTIVAWLLLGILSAQAQEIRYFYDDLGRLIGVVDEQGNAARYVYDAVGNILEIRRTNVADFAGPVAITFFDPDRGRVGTEVMILGAGFSSTPSENQVAFNGVAATVTAASPTSLTTSVPAGATTGPISVTTPLGSATSLTAFTVLGDIQVTVDPPTASVVLGRGRQFTASVANDANQGVLWGVNGVAGGNATVGTITQGGFYQAPTQFPAPTVTIEATSIVDPSKTGTARLFLLDTSTKPLLTAPSSVSVIFLQTPGPLGPLGGPLVSVEFPPVPAAPLGPVGSPLVSAEFPPPTEGVGPLSGPLASVAFRPLITAVNPSTGPQGAIGLALTITGEGLQGATALQFLLNGSPDPNLVVTGLTVDPTGTTANATVDIAATAALGPRVVTITTPQGTSTAIAIIGNVFTVVAP